MTKVLSSISRDSPAATLSASVNDTFSFAGTPGFTGTGGVQRYDWRWQVNPGSGYVLIDGTTGLSSPDTNPLINTNSASQNAITVTCATPGTYTIRMIGAPTSGGASTVISPTATVTVSAAAITGTMAATEAADTFAGSGTVLVEGALAATEPADTFAASGGVLVQGALSATEAQDTFDASGTVADAAITGTLAATEAADTFEGNGLILVSGSFAATEATDTYSGAGQIIVSGALAATEAGDGFAASGSVTGAIFGTFAAVEAADYFNALGRLDNAYLRARFRRSKIRDYRNTYGRVGP